MVHLIDAKFKLRDIIIFTKPFSDVSHTTWEIEKARLAGCGIGKDDSSKTAVIDTVHLSFFILLY